MRLEGFCLFFQARPTVRNVASVTYWLVSSLPEELRQPYKGPTHHSHHTQSNLSHFLHPSMLERRGSGGVRSSSHHPPLRLPPVPCLSQKTTMCCKPSAAFCNDEPTRSSTQHVTASSQAVTGAQSASNDFPFTAVRSVPHPVPDV